MLMSLRRGVFAAGPVPVRVKSETALSTFFGVLRAMFDFGESRTEVLEMALEKRGVYVFVNKDSGFSAGAMGEKLGWTMLLVLLLGEGVRGIRPPAMRVEKMLWWLLIGVDTAVAILCMCFLFSDL